MVTGSAGRVVHAAAKPPGRAVQPQRRAQRSAPDLQRKPLIGPVDDPLEREADRIADAVAAGGLAPPVSSATPRGPQRQCATCLEAERDGGELCQECAGTIRRQMESEEPEEEDELRLKPADHAAGGAARAASAAADAVSSGGRPMPAALRAYFEPRFGRDTHSRIHGTDGAAAASAAGMLARQVPRSVPPDTRRVNEHAGAASGPAVSLPRQLRLGLEALSALNLANVRIHKNSPRPALLGADAYVQGVDIFLGPGRECDLPHEGWHAVQQLGGHVRATARAGGMPINDDAALEQEADVMGARALAISVADQPIWQSARPALQGRGIAQLRRKGRKNVSAEALREVNAAWFADALFSSPLSEVGTMLDSVDDIALLYATLDVVDAVSSTSEDERRHKAVLHIGLINRLERLEALEAAHREIIDLVVKIRKTKGPSIDSGDEATLRGLLEPLPKESIRKLEKQLVLWPVVGAQIKMNKLIDIVTSYDRGTDPEESRRGRFPEAEGAAIEQSLTDRAKDFGVNECLNFLANASLKELFADEEADTAEALSEYAKGARERAEETKPGRRPHHAKTLSRLASELRLKGLVGAVNILQWRGRDDTGHHVPAAGDLFVRLSDAGPGWYFFLCNQISFHTFVMAVHVSGSVRRFFEIQGGQSLPLTKEEVTERFDTRFANPEAANSRVWQIYLVPEK